MGTSFRTGSWSKGKRFPVPMIYILYYIIRKAECMFAIYQGKYDLHLPEKEMAPGCTMRRRPAGGGIVTLRAMFCSVVSWHVCRCYSDTIQLRKNCCYRLSTTVPNNSIPYFSRIMCSATL